MSSKLATRDVHRHPALYARPSTNQPWSPLNRLLPVLMSARALALDELAQAIDRFTWPANSNLTLFGLAELFRCPGLPVM